MPLTQDNKGDGSWGCLSQGWPQTSEYAYSKYVFLNQSNIVPYGSYVLVGLGSKDSPYVLRVETLGHLKKLNENYTIVRKYILGDQ